MQYYSSTDLTVHSYAIFLLDSTVFFCFQAALTPRLVRKKYRSFRIYVVRVGGARSRRLTLRETVLVARCIWAPQVAFYFAFGLIGMFVRKLGPEAANSINGLGIWLRFLAIGPFAIWFAVRAKYPGFRLQGCGLRRF